MSAEIKNWHENAYFGIHYDLHGHEDDLPGFCGKVDEEQLFRLWSEIKPDWVQCDGKGHPGYTTWFCKTGWRTPNLAKDGVRAYRNASKKLGIPLGIHYSGLRDGAAVRHNPDWQCCRADGSRFGDGICLTSSYADELMIPQLLELIDDYDVDGFWIDGDNWGVAPCWCPRCRKSFTETTGITEIPEKKEDPHWHAYLEFFRSLFEKYVTKYTRAVHARKPACMVCSNWLYSMRQPEEKRIADVDYLSGDFSPTYGADRAALEGRFLDSRRMPWDLMAWGFTRDLFLEMARTSWVMKSQVHLSQETAEPVALGGGTMVYLSPMRDGRLSDSEHKIIEKLANGFIHPRRELCFKTQSASEAAILHLAESYYAGNTPLYNLGTAHDAIEGALHFMQETQRSVDIISSEDTLKRLQDYKLIILPEICRITPEEKAAVLKFAEDGGIVFGTGAFFGGEFAEALGIAPDGDVIEAPVYTATNLANHRRTTAVRFNGEGCQMIEPVRKITPLEGTEVLNFIYPTKDGECEPGTVAPVASMGPYGKGVIACCCCPVFELFAHNHHYLLRDLVDDMIRRVKFEQSVQVDSPRCLEVILRRKNASFMINLLNRGAVEVMAPRRVVATDLYPVTNVKIKVKEAGKYSSVSLFPPEPAFRWKRISPDTLEITLPKVDIHSVITLK